MDNGYFDISIKEVSKAIDSGDNDLSERINFRN
ncbi:hypothetical protein HNQ02_003725 [Flavobacterium sp. 7E]|nr:hypothetical protein [Flavobacterium sp. 7E]